MKILHYAIIIERIEFTPRCSAIISSRANQGARASDSKAVAG